MNQSHRPAPAASASQAPTPTGTPSARGNAAAAEELATLSAEEPEHPVLHALGEAFGLGAGFVVTELLALLPEWSAPVHDAHGAPVQSVPGATREGDHDIEKRHTQVVGPKISAYAEKLSPGPLKDLLAGMGEGASDAPGASYRIENAISDHFHRD